MKTTRIIAAPVALVATVTLWSGAAQAANDWSDWQGLPDRYQGKILFRLQPVSKKGGYRYQLRNDYGQKVTVQFAIAGTDTEGAPLRDEKTLILEPGERKTRSDEQSVPYANLTNAAVRSIQFSGEIPKPELGGFYSASILIPALQKAIKSAEQTAAAADRDRSDAESSEIAARTGQDNPRTVSVGDGTISGSTVGNVVNQQEVSKQAGERAQQAHEQAHEQVKSLKQQLADAQAADAQAKAGERALQAALTAPAAKATSASPSTVSVPVATSGLVATATGTLSPPATSSAAPGAAGVPADKPTLSAKEMKSLYQSAQDAFGKKNWVGVESVLKPLLAGSGDAIKESDRANLYYRLGTAYDNDNKAPEAEAAYAQAVHLGIRDDSLYNNLATVEYSQNKFPEAEQSEQAAIKIKDSDASYYFNLGLIQAAQQKYADAAASYKSALHLDPGNAQIKKHLDDVQKAIPSK